MSLGRGGPIFQPPTQPFPDKTPFAKQCAHDTQQIESALPLDVIDLLKANLKI
jgi:hypothetical protein